MGPDAILEWQLPEALFAPASPAEACTQPPCRPGLTLQSMALETHSSPALQGTTAIIKRRMGNSTG